MRAVQILGSKANHEVKLAQDAPKPTPTGSEILIKVHAAGITADEVAWPEVYNTASRVPGHEISGVVTELGPEYSGPLDVGDAVYSILHADRGQGQAEFAIASGDEVSRKPTSLSDAEAAAIPIPAITSWEAIHKHSRMTKGTRVLVTGASGAVGSIFVQLAALLFEADIVALGSKDSHNHLLQLGAHEVIDYTTVGWESSFRKSDLVFDTVGGDVLHKCWTAVEDEGSIITVADPPPPWAFGRGKPEELTQRPNVQWLYFILSPDSVALDSVARLIDQGTVKPLAVKGFPVDQALEAWSYAAQRGRRQKAVIQFV